MGRRFLWTVVALTIAGANASAEGRLQQLALAPLSVGEGFSVKQAQTFEELLLNALDATAKFKATGLSDVQGLLGLDRQKALLGCQTDTACVANLAGAMGVDLIAIASVGRLGNRIALSLKVIDSRKSEVVARAQEIVEGEDGIIDAATRLAAKVVHEMWPDEPLQTAAPGSAQANPADPLVVPMPGSSGTESTPGEAEWLTVRFTSTPPGAIVSVDGRLLCEATPCSQPVAPGAHDVTMEKVHHSTARGNFQTAPGAAVDLTLHPLFATLSVTTLPDGLAVSINGESVGPGPVVPRELDPGTYEASVEDPCAQRVAERVILRAGDMRDVRLAPQIRKTHVRVTAGDAAGHDLEAGVVVDGSRIGSTPGTFEVPLCSKTVELTTADGRVWRGALELKEGVEGTAHAVFIREGPSARSESGTQTLPPEVLAPQTFTPKPMSDGRRAGIAFSVLGGVAAGLGGLLVAVGNSQWQTLDSLNELAVKNPSVVQQAAAIHSLELAGDVTFGIAAVLAAIGVTTAVAFP